MQEQKKDELNPQNTTPKQKENKYSGKLLIAIIIIVVIIEYYCYVYETFYLRITPSNMIVNCIVLLFFHILLFLMLLAFHKTLTTQPGSIPLYWGFYIGDEDSKRKRYCLICNAFKPERSHHCSVCNSCILNMDHHCPWVNNCIGFYNRKFFMQLLFYVCLLTFYISVSSFYYVFYIVKDLIDFRMGTFIEMYHKAIPLISYITVFCFMCIIINFFKFHIELVWKNSTTIESLDKEHQQENEKYNVSLKSNWEQVFGENQVLWFFPFDGTNSKPRGDGLTWEIKPEFRDSDLPRFNTGRNSIGKTIDKQNIINSNNMYNSHSPLGIAPKTLTNS